MGSGTAVKEKGKGICSQVEIALGDWKLVDNFLPLELGGVDVILGMQWLHTLGVVTEVDWRKLTSTFIQNEKKIVLRGDLSLKKTRVSLKHMMKTWTPYDQGFLIECRALEGGMTFAELYGIDDVPTIQELLPADIFGYRKNPAIKEWEVLISWKRIPPHEATWENCDDFARQGPHFQLEDKGVFGEEE